MSKSVNHNVPHLTTWFNSALATLGSILRIYIYDFFFFLSKEYSRNYKNEYSQIMQ